MKKMVSLSGMVAGFEAGQHIFRYRFGNLDFWLVKQNYLSKSPLKLMMVMMMIVVKIMLEETVVLVDLDPSVL